MPIAKYQLPDGRIGRFEVPEGTTPEQAMAMIQSAISANPQQFAAKPSDIPEPPGAPPQPKEASIPTQIAQNAGAMARGALALPAMATQAAQEAWNLTTPAQAWLANKMGYDRITPEMLQFSPENMALTDLQNVTSRAGVPEYGTQLEGATGGLTGATGARLVAGAAKSAPLRTLADTLSKGPAMQSAAGASAATGVEKAREAGWGPLAQLATGAAGAILPSALAAGTRAALVPSGVNLAERQAQFARAGVDQPTLGQLTQGSGVQQVESLAGKGVGGYGHRETVREGQAAGMGAKVDELADRLGNVHSQEEAGRIITKGLTGEGGFTDRFRVAQEQAYAKLDSYIPPDTAVVPNNLRNAIGQMTTPMKGATATTGRLINPKLKALKDDIESDLAANAQSGSAGMPYEAIKQIRSRIGEMLGEDEMLSGAPRAQLKRLYAALSEDMRDAAKATNDPRAMQAFDRANALTKAGHARVDNVLQSLMDKRIPEMVYKSATNPADMKVGASRIRTVLKSLNPDEADAVRSIFLRNLGNAVASKQNAAGDVFSSETFLTNWNKISPEAKAALFGRGELRRNLDDVAKVADDIRKSQSVLANPSGTGAVATGIGASTGVSGALFMGQPTLAAGIAAVPMLSNITSKLATSKPFIGWLAKETKAGGPITQGSIAALNQAMQDQPESVRREVKTYIQNLQQAQ